MDGVNNPDDHNQQVCILSLIACMNRFYTYKATETRSFSNWENNIKLFFFLNCIPHIFSITFLIYNWL